MKNFSLLVISFLIIILTQAECNLNNNVAVESDSKVESDDKTNNFDVDCSGIKDFVFLPSPNLCSEYYQCIGEMPWRMACPRGFYFSVDVFQCRPVNEAICNVDSTTRSPEDDKVSCEGIDNFGFLPSPFRCEEYYQCIDELAWRMSCPRGFHFSVDIMECRPASEALCFTFSPSSATTTRMIMITTRKVLICDNVDNFAFVASQEACDEYYQCIDGNAFRLWCPLNQHFDQVRQTCDDKEKVNCDLSGPTIPPTPPPSTPRVPPTRSCDGVPDNRLLRSFFNCAEYYMCVDGEALILKCPLGLYFDEEIQGCNNRNEVNCEVTITSQSTTPVTLPNGVDCDDFPNMWMIEHPTECSLYYQCIDGVSSLVSCPVGRYFNINMQGCAEPHHVNCGDRVKRTTTSLPTETETNPEPETTPMTTSTTPTTTEPPTTTVPTVPTVPTVDPIDICDGVPDETFVGSNTFCEVYYFCMNGLPTSGECQPGHWFDRNLKACAPSDDVECTLQTLPTTTGPPTTTESTPTSLCRVVRNATYIINTLACAGFYQCVDGEPQERWCRAGLWFNFIQQRCTPSYAAICILDDALCEGVEDGRTIRAKLSCGDYISCIGGSAFPGRCPTHMYFDEENQDCGLRENVPCEIQVPVFPPYGPCSGLPDFMLTDDPEDCSRYFVCYNDLVLMGLSCPDGQTFFRPLQACGNFGCSHKEDKRNSYTIGC